VYKRQGVDRDGAVRGHFCATGVRPKFAERLQAFGINLPDSLYDPSVHYETD
ncbi:CpaF family protein, partial [Klebsiella pneumoniae]